jgi:hypothetical protein
LRTVRIELHVRKDDAALVRGVVKALDDPARETKLRALLREHIGASQVGGLKALLAAARFEGVQVTRAKDVGRDLEL